MNAQAMCHLPQQAITTPQRLGDCRKQARGRLRDDRDQGQDTAANTGDVSSGGGFSWSSQEFTVAKPRGDEPTPEINLVSS